MDNSVVVRCPGGKVSFTIYQTPLVEDHQDPGLQREYTPAVPEDDVTVLPASVALRPRNAAEATKWKPVTENDLGTDYLVAVKKIIIWGTEMEDAWTLSECNIKNEDTAYLLLGSGIRSALYDLPGSENAETSFKPEQLGLGGLMHQNFTIDPEPEGWERHGTLAMRFYFFDTGHFKRKTGLELDAADNVERQCQVDGFVEDRFPSFRGRPAMVLMPSIAQLYKQFKGEGRQNAGNQDCVQNGQDPRQQGDMNEEVDHGERSIVLTQRQSPGKKFLSTLMCGREW
ncbi:hypothetical protein CEP52_006504 [Fusarium oligoseptatum]|uniref:Uncharacterized protein n=1 Tax=Fusarium oligoseptatum TaxID=2604345 RepID=A0A428TSG2_9HYPO|nr:hypothetical protein CEP52_006504 [Fusarium oligoseptatum]